MRSTSNSELVRTTSTITTRLRTASMSCTWRWNGISPVQRLKSCRTSILWASGLRSQKKWSMKGCRQQKVGIGRPKRGTKSNSSSISRRKHSISTSGSSFVRSEMSCRRKSTRSMRNGSSCSAGYTSGTAMWPCKSYGSSSLPSGKSERGAWWRT